MRFGPLPLAQAAGAILAHSHETPGGVLRKGHVLTPADLSALAQAGAAEVTVAALDPGDVAEDGFGNDHALRAAKAAKSRVALRVGFAAVRGDGHVF